MTSDHVRRNDDVVKAFFTMAPAFFGLPFVMGCHLNRRDVLFLAQATVLARIESHLE